MVYAGNTGMTVIPRGGQQVIHHHHNTFNLLPASRRSYQSPKSQQELAETVASFVQSRLT
jgi:hypothetical protein